MPRVKAKKRGSGGGAGAEKRQRDAAGVAVKDVAMEEDDEGGLEFEDDVEDEFIEEEAMVPAEDEDEEMGAEEVMARIALDERGGGTEAQASWDPLQNVRGEGELDDLRENHDCLKNFRARMAETGELDAATLDAIDAEVMAEIEQAVTEAEAAARPTAEQVTEDVYINYGAGA